jgi:hypothetical protein
MKRLSLILLVITLSCSSSKNDEIKNIEVMTYYYTLNKEQTDLLLDCIFYTRVDRNGSSEILRQIVPSTQETVAYEYKIDKHLIEKIETVMKSSDEKSFEINNGKADTKIYCGPIIRYKIYYQSGNSFSFEIDENISKSNAKFQPFDNLYTALTANAKTKLFGDAHKKAIESKQKEYEKFAIRQDTLSHHFPLPQKSQIKFTK